CFFFSSRRRHTRSKRDWSSDVCSSDLIQGCTCIYIGQIMNIIKNRGMFMSILSYVMIGVICLILVMSFIHFVHDKDGNSRLWLKERRFSMEIFYALLIIYCIVIIGFGLIYFIISFQTRTLIEYNQMGPVNVLGS